MHVTARPQPKSDILRLMKSNYVMVPYWVDIVYKKRLGSTRFVEHHVKRASDHMTAKSRKAKIANFGIK